MGKKMRKDRDTRVRVSVRGLAFTGTVEQAEEIWDYLEREDNPKIIQDFRDALWEQIKDMESKK